MILRRLKPYAKAHPKKSFLLLLLSMFLAVLIITGIVDTIHQRQVANSLDNLQKQLKDAGFEDPERTAYCWKLQTKLGPGAKHCSDVVKVVVNTRSTPSYINERRAEIEAEAEADKKLVVFANAIGETAAFSPSGARGRLPERVKGGLGFTSDSRHYRHNKSGFICMADYRYNEKKYELELALRCDATSWFVRNIDRGLF